MPPVRSLGGIDLRRRSAATRNQGAKARQPELPMRDQGDRLMGGVQKRAETHVRRCQATRLNQEAQVSDSNTPAKLQGDLSLVEGSLDGSPEILPDLSYQTTANIIAVFHVQSGGSCPLFKHTVVGKDHPSPLVHLFMRHFWFQCECVGIGGRGGWNRPLSHRLQ